MVKYEVYLDESGRFEPNDAPNSTWGQLSLISGFAYRVDKGEDSQKVLKDVVQKTIETINNTYHIHLIPQTNQFDYEAIHTTMNQRGNQITNDNRRKLSDWLRNNDHMSMVLNSGRFTVLLAYGFSKEEEDQEFEYNGYYRHMLIALMRNVTQTLRKRHESEEVEILFCIPTRQLHINRTARESTARRFRRMGYRGRLSHEGTDDEADVFATNQPNEFLDVREELQIEYVARTIRYNLRDALRDDNDMLGCSWGYYLADWICHWVKPKVNKEGKGVKSITDSLRFSRGVNPIPVVIAYNRFFRQFKEAKSQISIEPLRYLSIYDHLKSVIEECHNRRIDNSRYDWVLGQIKQEQPFGDAHILSQTVEMIRNAYNTPDSPQQTTAQKRYESLLDLLNGIDSLPSAEYAELCKQLMCCYQYRGYKKAHDLFQKYMNQRARWADPADNLDIMTLYSDTYCNVLAFEEAKDMMEFAIENYTYDRVEEMGNRWLIRGSEQLMRMQRLRAFASLALGRIYGFCMEAGHDECFTRSLETFLAIKESSNAAIVRAHYIHYLIQVSGDSERDNSILDQLAGYFGEPTGTNRWVEWLDGIQNKVNSFDGEFDKGVESMRFAVWLFLKALWFFLQKSDIINPIEVGLLRDRLFGEAYKKMLESVEKFGTPAESILTYHGLLAWHFGDTECIAKDVEALQNMSSNPTTSGIIKLLCDMGLLRIGINQANNTGHWEIDMRNRIRNDLIVLKADWDEIRPEDSDGESHIYTCIDDDVWDKLTIEEISKLLTYEFY